jgi:hypothetical protein
MWHRSVPMTTDRQPFNVYSPEEVARVSHIIKHMPPCLCDTCVSQRNAKVDEHLLMDLGQCAVQACSTRATTFVIRTVPVCGKHCFAYGRAVMQDQALAWVHGFIPLHSSPIPQPCGVCGHQYPTDRLEAAARGVIRLDHNPTHLCVPPPPKD